MFFGFLNSFYAVYKKMLSNGKKLKNTIEKCLKVC